MSRLLAIALVPLFAVACSCGSLRSRAGVPASLVCDRVTIATPTLADSLRQAGPGDCVIVPEGTYPGSFVLPPDVSLAASDGAMVVLQGDGRGAAVLTIAGGPRSTVMGLHINVTSGNGIAIEPGPANLIGVTVTGTTDQGQNALTASCTVSDCDQRQVVVKDSTLTSTSVGVIATGAWLRLENTHVTDMKGASLSAGTGVVATAGSHLSMADVTIDSNQNIGLLIDGADTRADIVGGAVNGNQGRGVWVQGVVSDGGVTVTVTGTQLSGNSLVGIGARGSSGLTLSGLTVEDTVARPIYLDISHSELAGDGVGLFAGSHDVLIDALAARRNSRAQVIADQTGANVKLTAPTVSDGQYRVVVQRTAIPVDVAPALVDLPGRELLVDGAPISAP